MRKTTTHLGRYFLSIMLFMAISINLSAATIGIGTGGTSTNTIYPINTCYGYNYSQQIVLASEYNVNGSAGNITAVRFYYSNGGTTLTNWEDWTVYLGHTTKTEFTSDTDWEPLANLTQVFSGTITAVAGSWVEVTFSTPFNYNGTDNIVIAIDENSSGYSCTANWYSYNTPEGGNRALIYRNDSTDPDPASPPTANVGPSSIIAQIQFEGVPSSCPTPSAATSSNITSTSADLLWSTSGATDWVVEYGTAGFTQGAGTTVAVTGNDSLNVSSLMPETGYEWYVREYCGGTDSSAWIGPNAFTTLATCPPPTGLSSSIVSFTEVNLDWTTGGATNWVIEYDTAGFTQGTGNILTASGNDSLNITGLMAETNYEWYVRDYCGGIDSSAWVGPNSFFTGYCLPSPSSVDGTGITNVTMGTINNTTGSETDNYGNYSSMITDAAQTTTLAIDITLQTGYTYNLWAWVDWNNDLDFDDAGEAFYLGESTSSTPTTFNASITIPVTSSIGNHRIRIGGSDSGLGTTSPSNPCYTGSYASFEDYTLNVTPAPPCITPTNPATSNITETTADLTWTTGGASDWLVEWGPAGFTQGNGTFVNVTGNDSLQLTGLTANTSYDWYVSDFCNPDTSTWSSATSFTTPCATFTAPYAENFDASTNTPNCWSNQNIGETWKFLASGGSGPGYGVQNSVDHTSGSGNFTWIDASSGIGNNELISPTIDLSGLTTPYVGFWILSNNTNDAAQNVIELYAWDGNAWSLINSYSDNNVNWIEVSTTLPASFPDTTQFKLVQVENPSGTGSAYYNDLLIDDFYVIEAPSCPGAPSNLSASDITTTSATLSFMNMNNATNWALEWDTLGFIQGNGTIVSLTDTFTTVSGLTPNTNYTFYVRDVCSPGDSSNWAGPYNFFTGYCDATPSSVDGSGITNVTMGTINNPTGTEPNNYGAYYTMITDAGQGGTLAIDITLETGYTYNLWAWVDWNNDLDFDDAGETYYLGESTSTNPTTFSSSINIPDTASLGNHRIRIGGADSGLSSSNPCYNGTYGSIEDYTLNIVTCPTLSSTIDTAICAGDSYLFDGQTLATSGTYIDTLQNSIGCDSIVTLNLTVNPTSASTIDTAICSSETFMFGGQSLSTTGMYMDTVPNALGCDSVITLNLTVNMPTTASETATICDGETYDFYGQMLTTAGTYMDTMVNSLGCDSVITLTLDVNMPTAASESATICDGDTYDFYGQTLTTAGTYMDTMVNSAGCDSVITLTLDVNMPTTAAETATICNGETYDFYGQMLTASGTYTHTTTNAVNCDSVITLSLTVNPTSATTLNESICEGNSYDFAGQSLTTAGTYMDTLANTLGCDSIVTLNLTVNPNETSTVEVKLCDGVESYTLADGTVVTKAGTYTATTTTVNGCDSTITYNVSDCIGIFEIANNVGMVAYPNPAKDKVNIEFSTKLSQENAIAIVNVLGQRVYNIENITSKTIEVETSNFTNGIYYIHVTSDNKTSVKSFVVSK